MSNPADIAALVQVLLSLPALDLREGERISGIEIDVVGGRFDAIGRIPADFSAEVEGPVSGTSTLRLEANHGLSWLHNTKKLREFATVVVDDEQRFAVSAAVEISTRDSDRRVALAQGDLILTEVQ